MTNNYKNLDLLAANIRLDILKMLENAGQGHLGGSLSIVELLTVLYGKHMKYDSTKPTSDDRDMLVLSKGHAGPGLYSALANVGFFDKEVLYTLNKGGTILPSHPDRNKTPGVDVTTGSLGQGTSQACGIATGFKLQHCNRYVYLIVGDGELNEGQCWEAFAYLAHYKLDNCIVFIDDNKKQLDGFSKDVMNPFSIPDKMKAFGFHVKEVDGSSLSEIDKAIITCKSIKDKALCIVLNTTKGQGIKEYEVMADNHSVKFTSDEVLNINHNAINELEKFIKENR